MAARRSAALSRSSTSASVAPPLESPNTYVSKLRSRQAKLLEVKEVGTSEPHEFSETAMARLERLQESYTYAQGDPSDGRWAHIPDMLQLICTRRRQENRYCITKPTKSRNTEKLDPPAKYLLAETEEEWLEWEKQRSEQRRVRSKVQKWQEEVAQAEIPEPEPVKDKGKAKEDNVELSVQTNSQQSQQSQLGFRVIKAAKRVSAAKPTANIGDITHSSFSPPSFPESQLATSTPAPPKAPEGSRRKPDPIARVEPSSPTPASPPFPYSQPTQPQTGVKRSRAESPPADDVSNKRARPSQEDASGWKPLSGPGHTTPPASVEATPHKLKSQPTDPALVPTTPKRPPTLMQILASQSRRSNASTPRKTLFIRPVDPEPEVELELDEREPSPHYTDHTEPLKDEKEVSELIARVPSSPVSSVRSFSQLAESDSSSSGAGSPPRKISPVAIGAFTQGDEVFDPEYDSRGKTTTTAPGRAPDGYGMYSSQFDVEGQIGAIQDLLDKDNVFDMFIREPTEEG